MELSSIERFKDDQFDIRDYLEEVYSEGRRNGSSVLSTLYKEVCKIKDALDYKEEELKTLREDSTPKDEIEEICNSLASLTVSEVSSVYLRSIDTKKKYIFKLDLIKYLEHLENNTLNITPEEISSSKPLALVTLLMALKESNKEYKEKIISLLESTTEILKDQYKASYSKGMLEECKELVPILFLLDLKEFIIDTVINQELETEYIHTVVTELDLLNSSGLSSLLSNLDVIEDLIITHIENTIVLLKTVETTETEYNKMIFKVFERLTDKLLNTIKKELKGTNNPLEYLTKIEAVTIKYSILKQRIATIVPSLKEKLQDYIWIDIKNDEYIEKEVEGLHIITDQLVGLLKDSIPEDTIVYKLNGELLTAKTKIEIDVIFRYLILMRKSLNRMTLFNYRKHSIPVLLSAQLGGASLIISRICSHHSRPFFFTNIHLAMFLCVKKMYSDNMSSGYEEEIEEAIERFTKAEDIRHTQIYEKEEKHLIDTLTDLLQKYDHSSTIHLLDTSLNYLQNTPLYHTVTENIISQMINKIKELIFTRTDLTEVKNLSTYLKELKKYLKIEELFSQAQEISKLSSITDILLMNNPDEITVSLEILQPTPEELQKIQQAKKELE
ncbi:hypothetical protein NEOKW01_0889 [Nematocida sp. AWRm80]|nr:hypothetical protein NEOKW01_0889 [Nematocida sp. AWRm80]